MKNALFTCCTFMLVFISLTACNTGGEKHSAEDEAKIKSWDSLVALKNADTSKFTFSKVVPNKWADECIKNFDKFYKARVNDDVSGDNKFKTKTDYVLFDYTELMNWLKALPQGANVNQIAIRLGRYPYENDVTDGNPPGMKKENARRLTAFIWPYFNGNPAIKKMVRPGMLQGDPEDPFNLGEIYPK
jgi:hypothetical protein